VAQDPHRGGDELELIAGLSADLHQRVRGIVGADLLLVGKVVEALLDRQEVRERATAVLTALVRRDVDLDGGFLCERGFEFRLVEQVPLLGRELLASRAKALRIDQALPLAVERDQRVALIDHRLLAKNHRLKRVD
jgi:hypothetical protein